MVGGEGLWGFVLLMLGVGWLGALESGRWVGDEVVAMHDRSRTAFGC